MFSLLGYREYEAYPRRLKAQGIAHLGQYAGLSQGSIAHTTDNLEMPVKLQCMSLD